MEKDAFMRSKRNCTSVRWQAALLVLVGGFALISVFRVSSAARAGTNPAAPQSTIQLESRINQLEQRLYGIEVSLRNLEQQSRVSGVSSRNVSPEDVALLRSELQMLERRLAEDECGLARLDERTLNREVRDARRKSSAARSDPCRLRVDEPLSLPERE